jgi:hypothetical protein
LTLPVRGRTHTCAVHRWVGWRGPGVQLCIAVVAALVHQAGLLQCCCGWGGGAGRWACAFLKVKWWQAVFCLAADISGPAVAAALAVQWTQHSWMSSTSGPAELWMYTCVREGGTSGRWRGSAGEAMHPCPHLFLPAVYVKKAVPLISSGMPALPAQSSQASTGNL